MVIFSPQRLKDIKKHEENLRKQTFSPNSKTKNFQPLIRIVTLLLSPYRNQTVIRCVYTFKLMQALNNKKGEIIAYLYQNMLIHPDDLQVLGLVLGNCVFSNRSNILGKMFQKKIYALSGEVLASTDKAIFPMPIHFNITDSVLQAWAILVKIKDHAYPWVHTKETWSVSSLAESLGNFGESLPPFRRKVYHSE